MTRYYYKSKEGNGWLNLKSPLPEEKLGDYIEMTEEQWNEHIAELNHIQEPTAEEVARNQKLERINFLKSELRRTDYQAIKYAEGWISAEDYAETKAQRQEWRDEINQLEGEL